MIYLTNAFSINMLTASKAVLVMEKLTTVQVVTLISTECFEVAIGHADTAAVVEGLLYAAGGEHSAQALGPIGMVRTTVRFEEYDQLVVAQYKGPRLPEGSTTLPNGATIEWWYVHHQG